MDVRELKTKKGKTQTNVKWKWWDSGASRELHLMEGSSD